MTTLSAEAQPLIAELEAEKQALELPNQYK
jgi:hypothetical protein